MNRRFAAPRRGADSPAGHELLGVVSSHGPSRESCTSTRQSRRVRTPSSSAPDAAATVSAQMLRAAFSTPTSTPAVLQRGVPRRSAKVVAVEGPTTLPGNGGRPTETEWAKPALPGTGQKPETAGARGG
jgi:hypothetical protein